MPIPLIATGISAGISALSANKARKQAQPLIDAQSAQATNMSNLAKMLQKYSGEQYALGTPALTKALDYYTKAASGDRGVMRQLYAPEATSIRDIYGGAQRSIERGPAGPGRDVQLSELSRERAGRLSQLPLYGRLSGVRGMEGIGSSLLDRSLSFGTGAFSGFGGAAGVNQNLLFDRRRQEELGYERSKQFGDMIGRLLEIFVKGGGGSKGGSSYVGDTVSNIASGLAR